MKAGAEAKKKKKSAKIKKDRRKKRVCTLHLPVQVDLLGYYQRKSRGSHSQKCWHLLDNDKHRSSASSSKFNKTPPLKSLKEENIIIEEQESQNLSEFTCEASNWCSKSVLFCFLMGFKRLKVRSFPLASPRSGSLWCDIMLTVCQNQFHLRVNIHFFLMKKLLK